MTIAKLKYDTNHLGKYLKQVAQHADTLDTLVTGLSAPELAFLDGVVAGTAQASKAYVADANKAVDVIRTASLRIGASGAETAVTATGTELNTTAGVTNGTVAASKHTVVDANKDIGTFRNLRITRVIRSGGVPLSDATNGAVTYTAAQVLSDVIVRDPGAGGATDVFPTAALLVAAIPGATIGDVIDVLIVNGADANEVLTLAAGAGGAFDANQTASSRVIGQNQSKLVRIRLTNVTSSSEAYVIYA